MSLSKSFKKGNVKNIANRESDFNYDSNYKFYKTYDEVEEMSLDSKHNRIKEFNNLLIKLKALKSGNPKTQLKKERIMKNVDELYEKYYSAYKNEYDNDDELSEGKKKKIDYKQFELFDKTDKKLTPDEETKHFIKKIENKEKHVDKKGFTKQFSYKSIALVNNLLKKSTQDLKKCLNEIKQQKIKLNEDERNNTNNKNKYDELNNILSVIDRIDQFFEYKFFSGEHSDELKSPKWVRVSEERFNEKLSTITKAQNDGLRTNVSGKEITLDNVQSLLKDLGNEILGRRELKNRYYNIANDVEAIVDKASITRSQNKIVKILSLLKEIPKSKKSDEEPNTTDMPELESEESAAERRNKLGEGLKILTPDEMLSRLPITLAHLKAGNNSQKLRNEIR